MPLISSAVPEVAVGTRVVVPNRACSSAAVRNASGVPSMKSASPPPWVWMSMKPGETYRPRASIDLSAARSRAVTSAMRPSSRYMFRPS